MKYCCTAGGEDGGGWRGQKLEQIGTGMRERERGSGDKKTGKASPGGVKIEVLSLLHF